MDMNIEKIQSLQIPVKIKNDLIRFLKEIQDIFKNNLICVIVYGAAIKENYIKGVNGLNVLIVVNEIDIIQIEKVAYHSKKYQTNSDIIPKFLSKKNILTGFDVFAIDYMEIKLDGILIFGYNILENKEILDRHLVFQLERDTKAMRMKIIQEFWRSIDRIGIMRKNLFIYLKQIIKLLRIMLLIKKITFKDKFELIKKSSEILNFNENVLLDLIKLRDEGRRITKKQLILYYQDIFAIIEKMDNFFDEWNK